MKNIRIVYPNEMDEFFASFWETKEFKDLQIHHPYFKAWVEKLKEAPLFFFDLSHENGKYHLTSHMRLIPHRDYGDNHYMRDLYYFHEITHCAEFIASSNNDYVQWKNKLNDNELYASIVSEVLIYYFAPSMIGKTFNPLWAKRFYDLHSNNKELVKDELGFFIKEGEHKNYDLMTFNNIQDWPKSIQDIVERRKELRNINNSKNLEKDEAVIIEYNIPRQKWIEKWESHYRKIDDLLIALKNNNIQANDYLDAMFNNCDEFYRPFFPK